MSEEITYTMEKSFASYTSDRGFTTRIYEELKKFMKNVELLRKTLNSSTQLGWVMLFLEVIFNSTECYRVQLKILEKRCVIPLCVLLIRKSTKAPRQYRTLPLFLLIHHR